MKEGGATDGLTPPPTPSAAPTSHNSRPKLPKLELQHFSGETPPNGILFGNFMME